MVTTTAADTMQNMGTVTLAARVLMGLVFATAAVTKLPQPAALRSTFREFGAGERLARLAIFLAPAELAVAVGLAFVPSARWSAMAGTLLLLVFVGGMLNALRLGRRPDCGCFGGLRRVPIGSSTLVRNGVLIGVSGLVAAFGPGPTIGRWLGSHDARQILLVAIVIVVALVGFVFGNHGRTSSVAVPTAKTSSRPRALTVGQAAPEFSTYDTNDEQQTLASLLASGRPLVLMFGSAGCGSCATVLSQIARWQATMAHRLQITVVASGDAVQAELARAEYHLASVLVDDDRAISQVYEVRVVPAAYVVSPEGTISNGPAIGPDAIEDLIRLSLHRGDPMTGPWNRTINAA